MTYLCIHVSLSLCMHTHILHIYSLSLSCSLSYARTHTLSLTPTYTRSQEKIVEVPVEKIVYRDVPVERIVTKEVPVEKIVEKIVEVEKIVQVPVDRIVEVEKFVEIEKIVTKEVPVETIVYRELPKQRTPSPPPQPPPPQVMTTEYKVAHGGSYNLKPRGDDRVRTPQVQTLSPTSMPRSNLTTRVGHDVSIADKRQSFETGENWRNWRASPEKERILDRVSYPRAGVQEEARYSDAIKYTGYAENYTSYSSASPDRAPSYTSYPENGRVLTPQTSYTSYTETSTVAYGGTYDLKSREDDRGVFTPQRHGYSVSPSLYYI
jgi:hypothetical protein